MSNSFAPRPERFVLPYTPYISKTNAPKLPDGISSDDMFPDSVINRVIMEVPKVRWDVFISGSLRHERVVDVTQILQDEGLSVFSDWKATAPDADDHWKAYEQARGRDYLSALHAPAARNTVAFDRLNLENSNAMVLVYPAGRSSHIELGYARGMGKPGFVLLDTEAEDDRWDVMLGLATDVFRDVAELVVRLKGLKR